MADNEVSHALADVLENEAKRAGMGIRELGKRAGNKNAIYKMRGAKPSTITVESFWKMCEVLGLAPYDVAYRVDVARRGSLAGRET